MSAASLKKNAPWVQVNPSVRGSTRTHVEIRFAPNYIRSLWRPRAARERGTRGVFDDAAGERLLFDGTIPVEGASMFVQAWLVPAAEPGAYHIRVTMAAPAPLKKRVLVRLYWDNGRYTASLARGEWLFEDITEPNYSRRNGNLPTRRLRMTFEFQDDDDDKAS